MMYPFMSLPDETEIVHSDFKDGKVKVYIEKPDEKPDEKDGFHHATCYLPGYVWTEVYGFSEAEMQHYRELAKAVAPRITSKVRSTL